MEAKHPHSSTHLPEGLTQDSSPEPSNSHKSPSQSSAVSSSTGNGSSAQSMTATTASLDPIVYQAVLDHHYNRVTFPDHQHDLSHLGSWDTTIEPFDATPVIGNEHIISPNYQSGTAVNATNGLLGPVAAGGDTKEEAVELLRANLHRGL